MTTSNTIKSLNANLEVLNTQLLKFQDRLAVKVCDLDSIEIDQDDFIASYESSLDECHGEFMGMTASNILKNTDPTAYRCGLLDYCDCEDVTETEEYITAQDEIEELESEIEELESEIEDAKEALEEENGE